VRIAYTSDLHIDLSERNLSAARAVAASIRTSGADAVVVAGDAANTVAALEEALSLFAAIDVPKFFVPGNHDVWIETASGRLIDSRTKFSELIPEACRKAGFHDLGAEPVVIGDVGFVGSLGWYDYSFADARLQLDEDDYWRGRYGDEIWWDRKMTYWVRDAAGEPGSRERMRDPEVCAELAGRLREHLLAIEERARTIVAVVHTLPFFVGIERSDPPFYLDAYTGSARLGDLLDEHPKVERCIHGHKHRSGDWTVGRIRLVRRTLGRIEAGDDSASRAVEAVGLLDA
jgi:3',5'-cyclic AMP phosphodiesterase CpdA